MSPRSTTIFWTTKLFSSSKLFRLFNSTQSLAFLLSIYGVKAMAQSVALRATFPALEIAKALDLSERNAENEAIAKRVR